MKKSVIIIIIICVIVFVLLAGLGGFLFVKTILNKEKDPITVEEFKSTMKSKGYEILNVEEQFDEYNYIKDAYIAMSSDEEYQIEFYKISDVENATMFYNYNKSIFESSKSASSMQTNNDMKNYSKYTLQSNDKYMVISRIEDTVVYVKVDSKYKEKIKDVLDEIGY